MTFKTSLKRILIHRPSPPQWLIPAGRTHRHRCLVSPAILYLIILTQIPLVVTLYYSTQQWNLLRPDRRAFIGLENYSIVIENPDFWPVLWITLLLTLSVVLLTLVFGFILALLLNRPFFGRGLARTLLITPFLIMPTVAAVLWKNVLFNPAFGLFSSSLASLGFDRIDWLADFPLASVTCIVVWQWTPFMMLILLAGLQSLPREQLEAGRIDGAGPISTLRYITLPHLKRYIEIAILLEVLFILSVFGVIFVTTSGGPGTATTNLAYHIYKEAFERWNIGRASTLGVLAIVLANLVVLLFLRVLRDNTREVSS